MNKAASRDGTALRPASPSDAVIIRTHRIGDVGWAIERHAQVYAEEFQWNEEFAALQL